jgi:uncharacterized protein YcbX
MEIGTVAALWRYPVKSLAAEALSTVMVEADGLAGDRRAALIVSDGAHPRAGKPYRGKEHRLLHTVATPALARDVTAHAAIAFDVVSGERYFDVQAVSLLWDIWLHDVEALVGKSLDPLRYRANIYARAAPGFTAREHELVGATIGIGGAILVVVATIGRCVTTTYDIATGASDPAVLREVAQRRGNTVGVYCRVETPGNVANGDAIRRL